MAFSVLAKEEPLPEYLKSEKPILLAEADLPDLPQIHHHLEDEKEDVGIEANGEAQNAILKKEAESKVINNIVDQVYSKNLSEESSVEDDKQNPALSESKEEKQQTIDLTSEQETYSITVEVEENKTNQKLPDNSEEQEIVEKNEDKANITKLEKEESVKLIKEDETKPQEVKKDENKTSDEDILKSNKIDQNTELKSKKQVAEKKIEEDIKITIGENETKQKLVAETEKEEAKPLSEEKSKTEIIIESPEQAQKEQLLTPPAKKEESIKQASENNGKTDKIDKKEIEFDNFGTYTKVKLPETNIQNSIIKKSPQDNISQAGLVINNNRQDFISIIDNEFKALEDISDIALENKKIDIKTDIDIDRGTFNDPFYEEVTASETAKIADELSEDMDLGVDDLEINENVKDFPPPSKVVEAKPKSFHMREKSLKVKVKKVNQQERKYLQYAHEAMQVGQYESAISYYREILSKNPNNQKVSFGLATAYHKAGQYESAKEEYLKIINRDKNNISALNNYLILVSQENPDIAVERLENLRINNPEFAAIPAQIGSIYYGKGKLEQASEYYFEAVKLSPKNTSYRYNLAIILEEMKQDKYAAQLYKSLLDDATKGVKLPESPITIKERFFSLISER